MIIVFFIFLVFIDYYWSHIYLTLLRFRFSISRYKGTRYFQFLNKIVNNEENSSDHNDKLGVDLSIIKKTKTKKLIQDKKKIS